MGHGALQRLTQGLNGIYEFKDPVWTEFHRKIQLQ